MLKKLLKYEFMSTGRVFGLCYAGVLGAALLLRILGALAWDNTGNQTAVQMLLPVTDIAAGISSLLYGGMVIAVIVVTFIFILQRFYKNLLGGEGYLMQTLPVTPRQLISSKLIAAVVWTVLSSIVVILSVLVLAMSGEMFGELVRDLGDIIRFYHETFATPLTVLALEMIVVCVVGIAASVLQIYAAIMIGHQAAKHKIALAVGAYFGISVVISVASSILMNLLYHIVPNGAWNALSDWLFVMNDTPMLLVHILLLGYLVFNLVLAVIFFAVTEWMMRRNLNLE